MSAEVAIDIAPSELAGETMTGAPRTGSALPPTDPTLPKSIFGYQPNPVGDTVATLGNKVVSFFENIFSPKPSAGKNFNAADPTPPPTNNAASSGASDRFMNPSRTSNGVAKTVLKVGAATGAATAATGAGLSLAGQGISNIGTGVSKLGSSAANSFANFDKTLGLPNGSSFIIIVAIVILLLVVVLAK